jgi:uncharacterized protein DUF4352
MRPRDSLGLAVLVVGTLLACKKKKEATTTPTTPVTTPTATETAPPPLPDKLYKLGESAKANDYNLTVDNVQECKRKWSAPKKGNIFLGVEATVESLGDKQFLASPTHAKVIDSQSLTYNSLGYASTTNCDPTFKFTQLAKGEKAKGWLIFEVPKAASGLKMSYNPVSFGTPQTVKFDLGR